MNGLYCVDIWIFKANLLKIFIMNSVDPIMTFFCLLFGDHIILLLLLFMFWFTFTDLTLCNPGMNPTWC